MYFSRAPIPWWRHGFDAAGDALTALPMPRPLRHIGI
jgi:3-deoxy-manno-octulosonate cytidylyltransferase (CMP-KDO synthetase)